MRMRCCGLGAVVLCAVTASLPAQPPMEDPDEIPLIGRPADLPFSEASAGFVVTKERVYLAPFQIRAEAQPTRLPALASLTLTVTVQAMGKIRTPPRRIDLREVSGFTQRFHIDDFTDRKKGSSSANTWQWVYRLRPRRETIREIPGVPFVFYNPDLRPVEKAFQIVYTDPIPIEVQSEERLTVPAEAPDLALRGPADPFILRSPPPWRGPEVWLWVTLALVPPMGCAVWYGIWWWLHPDEARLAHQRRSRAAQRALMQLSRLHRLPERDLPDALTHLLTCYFRERLELPQAEPTPTEIRTLLTSHGYTEPITHQGEHLFSAMEAARFCPGHIAETDLPDRVKQLILHLEDQPCGRSS